MITVFNRKELTTTFSMKQQAQVRDTLSANGIDYTVKSINRKSPSALSAGSRARTGTLGENSELSCEYIFYVKKADYDRAIHLLK